MPYLERDFKKGILFVDDASKSIYRLGPNGEKAYLSEEECNRRFRKHARCGGWFLTMQDPNAHGVALTCIKCGSRESVSYKSDCAHCPD
jgi:hypothetical protein